MRYQLVRIGERMYQFTDQSDTSKARELYVKCTGNQNVFEQLMISGGIHFDRIELP